MKVCFIVLLSLLAVGNAATLSGSFVVSPVAVYNQWDTKLFTDTNQIAHYIDNTTIVIYGAAIPTGGATTYTLAKRYVNISASTWTFSASNDASGDTGYATGTIGGMATSQNGYGAIAATVTSSLITNVFLTIFPSTFTSSGDFKQIQVTANTDATVSYNIYQVFGKDSYIFVLYSTQKTNKEDALYLQGYLTTNTSATKFGTPVKINSASLALITEDTLDAQCGVNPATDGFICTYKDTNLNKIASVSTTFTASSGTGSASGEVTVATDVATVPTTLNDVLGIISGGSYYVIVTQVKTVTAVPVTTYTINAYINQTSTATSLNFTIPTGYTSVSSIIGGRYYDGFFVGYVLSPTTGSDYSIQVQNYKADGSVNGSVNILGTANYTVQGIPLVDSSYVVLFQDTYNSKTAQGMVGKLYAATRDPILPAFATTFKGFIALLSFMLLSVFAF